MYFLINACQHPTILRVLYFVYLLLDIVFVAVPILRPVTRICKVDHGAIITSSSSMPIIFAPFDFNTPTTSKETSPIRNSLPIGDKPLKSSLIIVVPTIQTRALEFTSELVKHLPSAICQLRISR